MFNKKIGVTESRVLKATLIVRRFPKYGVKENWSY